MRSCVFSHAEYGAVLVAVNWILCVVKSGWFILYIMFCGYWLASIMMMVSQLLPLTLQWCVSQLPPLCGVNYTLMRVFYVNLLAGFWFSDILENISSLRGGDAHSKFAAGSNTHWPWNNWLQALSSEGIACLPLKNTIMFHTGSPPAHFHCVASSFSWLFIFF